MKSAIRKLPTELVFIKLQLKKIWDINKVDDDLKEWISSSLELVDHFCVEILKNQKNLDQISIIRKLEEILSVYIREKTEDKEQQRKRVRKEERLLFLQQSERQQELALYARSLTSTRGPDPLLNGVCELVHLCRWGTRNIPIGSSKRSAPRSSTESSIQKKNILFLIAKLLKNLGLGKRKSIDTLIFSINTAYGNWNVYSIGGHPRSNKPVFSSKLGWNPNS